MVLTLAMAGSNYRIDMHVQPRVNPLARNDFFSDQRSAQPPIEGTMARNQLRDDTYFYTGKIGNNPSNYMPFAVTKEVLGGYYLLDCADLDEALKHAARLPLARYGSVEVRPIMDIDSIPTP